MFGEYGTERHEQVQKRLIDDLDKSLRELPGDTIEERWNSFMDELDCQSRADKGVYLIPWKEYDSDDWQNLVVTRSHPWTDSGNSRKTWFSTKRIASQRMYGYRQNGTN